MAERRFPTPEYGKHHKTQLDSADLRIVSSDEKVFDFPKAEITSEEKVRRAMAEAKRPASLAPGEWRLWIDRAAERLGVPRATLEGLISAIIKDSERKAREDKAEARRQEERVRRQQRERKREQQGIDKKAERKSKEKQKSFERLISLPSEQHETRLAELKKRFDEDVARGCASRAWSAAAASKSFCHCFPATPSCGS